MAPQWPLELKGHMSQLGSSGRQVEYEMNILLLLTCLTAHSQIGCCACLPHESAPVVLAGSLAQGTSQCVQQRCGQPSRGSRADCEQNQIVALSLQGSQPILSQDGDALVSTAKNHFVISRIRHSFVFASDTRCFKSKQVLCCSYLVK